MSVIYFMECGECGESLEFKASLDGSYDLYITVDPCETCLNEARIETENREDE